ncbi:MAG: DNA internalization-related competence protein ComEC/Rec2 [Candidatus Sumerlaeia bacterium]|nr:DNA internalization-related competence protein ComEC/Rec2 [Candidatus Sumerlaeia bacterium]
MEFVAEREVPRPSLVAVLALIAGIVWSRTLDLDPLPAFLFLAVALALAILLSGRDRFRLPLLAVTFAALGLALMAPHNTAERQARQQLSEFEAVSSAVVVLRGTIAGEARRTGERVRVFVAPGARIQHPDAVVTMPVPIAVWLSHDVQAPMPDLAPGDHLEAVGRLLTTSGNPAPGDPEYWLASQGTPAMFRATTWESESPTQRTSWARFRLAMRRTAEHLEATMLAHLSERAGPVLVAATLGRTQHLTPAQREAFRRAGLLHIFAVSGLHAGLVGVLLALLAAALGIEGRGRVLLVIGGLVLFCVLTGLRISALRATCLVTLFLLQPMLRRHVDVLGMLASVALVFLVARPLALWQVDFQLSFLCALTIVLAMPGAIALEEAIGRRWKGVWGLTALIRIVQTIFLSTCIQLALLPVLSAHLREVSLVAPLANAVVLPFLGALLGVGFAAALLAWAIPAFGVVLFAVLDPCLLAAEGLSRAFSALPGAAMRAAPWTALAAGLYWAVLLAGRWIRLRPRFTPLDGGMAAALHAVAALGLALWIPLARPAPELLRVTFLDVGQGDAILVQARDGATMLVDAGPPRNGVLVRELALLGVDSLDVLVLTHADADHIGDAAAIVEALRPGIVLTGGSLADTQVWRALDTAVRTTGTQVATVRRGATMHLSLEIEATVLHPTEAFVAGGLERNDASVVLRIVAGDVSFLLTGDAESAAELDMVRTLPSADLRSTVLKAGHHGAATSSGMPLLATVRPAVAIISCGRSNRYGHPAPDVLARLAEVGAAVWRTDTQGTLVATTDGTHLTLRTRRALPEPTNR